MQTICTALVVKPMMKPAMPSDTISRINFHCGSIRRNSSLKSVFLPVRNITTHMADTNCEIVAEVSPKVASLILKSKINLATSNTDSLDAGYIGSVAGCKVYVTNNVKSAYSKHQCYVRTKRAIAYAEQLSEVHAYRPELRFADAVKGLHLYGAKVVYPKEMVLLDLGVATTA